MPLTLYNSQHFSSGFTAAVMAELEYGEDTPLAKREQLDIDEGDARVPDYIAKVNPNGSVPVIIHDGISIWESAAITMYLGETFGEKKGLYPPLGPTRGEAMKWIVWTNVTLAVAFEQQARERLEKHIEILNGALEGRDYLLESGYCLADTHVWAIINWFDMMLGVKWDPYPNIKDWLRRVGERPALKKLW